MVEWHNHREVSRDLSSSTPIIATPISLHPQTRHSSPPSSNQGRIFVCARVGLAPQPENFIVYFQLQPPLNSCIIVQLHSTLLNFILLASLVKLFKVRRYFKHSASFLKIPPSLLKLDTCHGNAEKLVAACCRIVAWRLVVRCFGGCGIGTQFSSEKLDYRQLIGGSVICVVVVVVVVEVAVRSTLKLLFHLPRSISPPCFIIQFGFLFFSLCDLNFRLNEFAHFYTNLMLI